MKKLAIFSLAFLMIGCSSEKQVNVAQLEDKPKPVVTPIDNCDIYVQDDTRVVPSECVREVEAYSVYQEVEVEHNHYHNVAGAVAVGAVAGAVAKSAYDKNKAKKAPVKALPTPTRVPVGKPVTPPVQTVKKIDLSKQKYTKSTTKPSYTAPSRKTTTYQSSRSKR